MMRRSAVGFARSTIWLIHPLLQERQTLEDRIGVLKLRKPAMDQAQYDQELEKLLTDLALKSRAIQQIEGKK